jgi:DNA repair ATPase RecN
MSATETAATSLNAEAYTFARFWKCALQVNPEGYSKTYRGQDHGLKGDAFLDALLKECQEQDIRLIGLADHGSVQDVDAIRAHLTPHEIVVLPGFEISTTEKIHWVCLFPENTTTDQLNRYLGALDLLNPKDGVLPSRLGGAALLSKVAELKGFCYAAHVTSSSGLLERKQQNLWRDEHLVAAQIPGSVADLPPDFKPIAENKNPEYRRERPLALINAKDVAKPEDLRDPRASCLIKMTRPSFDSLCMAFKDPESRVRLHGGLPPEYYSRIERIHIEGGYLDGVDIRLSPHLNAIIGGRGTGKSTLLESLRYALDLEHKSPEARKQGTSIIKENLGREHGRIEVDVVSKAQNMHRYRVVRRYGEPPRVIDAQGNESSLTVRDLLPGIEIYGQNEIYELARDEDALVRVLDRFLPDRHQHQTTLDALHRKLKANREKLITAHEQRDELKERMQKLPRLEEQAKQFDAIGLKEKLRLVPLLEKERQLPARMEEEVARLSSSLNVLRDSLPDTTFLGDKAIENLPHANVLVPGRTALERVKVSVEQHINAAAGELKTASEDVEAVIAELNRVRSAAEEAMEKEFAKLPEVAGKPGSEVGRTYQSLQREIEAIRPQQARLNTLTELIETLEQERRNLLGELSDLRNTRTRALEGEIKRLNKKLAGKLHLHVVPNGNRQALKDFLARLPGIGDKSVAWVDEASDLTIPALVEACRAGSDVLLAKKWGVTTARAETICKMARAEVLALETVDLEDRVVLELNVAHEGVVYRPLDRLSTGQQCTAILHLLLLDNPDPLVMDQPEDNLDNAFIADRIVQELRTAKTARQFLFATHNANIPVFGDAEWIGVFTATEDHGAVPPENQGSIDVPQIRDEAARILDGGREAFLQRREKYGY